jgi:hypothetical protein
MKLAVSCATCTAVLCLRLSFAGCQVETDQSRKIIDELASHLPKGEILFGKSLPSTVKSAIKELVALTRERQTAGDLTDRLVLIRNMNRFLADKGVTNATQRDQIKRFKTAFTIDEHWPIYLNGESDLLAVAPARSYSADDPVIYKLAAVIAHERVHAQGEKSERKAIEEEIRILEVFVVRRLVELQWLTGRKATLAQIMNGHLSDEPFKVIPSRPPIF